MTELNRELKEYLSRSDGKSESKEPLLPTTIRDIKIPKIGSWFTRNGSAGSEEDDTTSTSSSSSSWFSSAQSDPCLPSLVSRVGLWVSVGGGGNLAVLMRELSKLSEQLYFCLIDI